MFIFKVLIVLYYFNDGVYQGNDENCDVCYDVLCWWECSVLCVGEIY